MAAEALFWVIISMRDGKYALPVPYKNGIIDYTIEEFGRSVPISVVLFAQYRRPAGFWWLVSKKMCKLFRTATQSKARNSF